MQNTTYYNLPKYQATDTPNLILGYNAAMDLIDTALHTLATASGDFNPTQQDADLNVTDLSNAKVTANGIIYKPTSS